MQQVPPLCLGDPGDDTETEVELNTPRLNNPLFQKLKKKYPRAFRRRSTAFSDTSSVCSLSLPGTPRTPRRLSFPPPQSNGNNLVNNSEKTENSYVDNTVDNNGFEHSMEDLTISGVTPLRISTPRSDHSFTQDYPMHSSSFGRTRPLSATPASNTEEKPRFEKDSKLSLKERLHRNKKNLRELLDEKYPFKNRSLSVFTAATDNKNSHNIVSNERPKGNSSRTNESRANHILSYCASKPPKPTNRLTTSKRLTNGNLSLHNIEHKTGADTLRQGRTIQNLDQKQLYCKRFSSPDSGGSTHDSAVDVDSASLQSSPSSSDHNHSPDLTTAQRTSYANTSTHHSLPPRPGRYAPKLKSRRSAQQNSETDQFSLHNRGKTIK